MAPVAAGWYGRSLHAISSVNREFRGIAAPEIFMVRGHSFQLVAQARQTRCLSKFVRASKIQWDLL